MTTTRSIATLATFPLFGAFGNAQTVRGVVLDRGDVPVPGVVVQLLDSGSTVAARALSNDRGEFRAAATRPGAYRLRTMRIGYLSLTSGVVVDSVSERASAGVTVTLSGTNLSGVADSRGRFTIPGVPRRICRGGANAVARCGEWWYQTPLSFADASTRVELRVPTGDQLQSSICGGRRLDSPGIVLGTVDFLGDSSTRRATTVVAEWTETVLRSDATAVGSEPQRKRMESRTDPRGMFRLCGVPVNTRLALRASANGVAGVPVDLEIPSGGRFARAALTVGASATRLALTGVVLTDSTHEPIAGAEVSLSDLTIGTLTDPQGRFSITNLRPGEYSLIARRVGFGPLNTRVVVSAAESNERRIYLSRVTMLDSVVKESATSAWLKEFEDNRRTGLGQFFTRDDLERRKALSLDAVATELRGTVLVRTTGVTAYLATKRQVNFCPPKDIECMKKEALVYLPSSGTGIHPGAVVACYAQVYLDRMLLNSEHPAEPVDLRQFTPSQLEAMEYYDGITATPSRYSRKGSGAECSSFTRVAARDRALESLRATNGRPCHDAFDLHATIHTKGHARH